MEDIVAINPVKWKNYKELQSQQYVGDQLRNVTSAAQGNTADDIEGLLLQLLLRLPYTFRTISRPVPKPLKIRTLAFRGHKKIPQTIHFISNVLVKCDSQPQLPLTWSSSTIRGPQDKEPRLWLESYILRICFWVTAGQLQQLRKFSRFHWLIMIHCQRADRFMNI